MIKLTHSSRLSSAIPIPFLKFPDWLVWRDVMLDVSHISCSISGYRILNDLSISISEGEAVGIIGPNGSGKTTLFNCLSGFATIQKGLINFLGEDICRLTPDQRAQLGLGRVFQNFGIFRSLSVLQNVTLAFEAKLPLYKSIFPSLARSKRFSEAAEEILQLVGLIEFRAASASSLSGGQMRLLEMARVIAADSKLFLLDEPTAGVSPKMKDAVLSVIDTLIQKKKTILVIEHDMTFIRSFVQRMIVLDQGSVVLDGSCDHIMTSDVVHELYFGKQKASVNR